MNVSPEKLYLVDRYFDEMEKVMFPEGNSCNEEHKTVFFSEHEVLYGSTPNGTPTKSSRDQKLNMTKQDAADTSVRGSHSALHLALQFPVDDLNNLTGPLTEDAVLKTLQVRFYSGKYYTKIGQVLLALNPHSARPCSRVLDRPQPDAQLQKVVRDTVREFVDTGCSQTIILNGVSGSGKTHTSRLLLRELFDVAGAGTETDSFKGLNAALTVLHGLGSSATSDNPQSSRMGYFIENHISDGAIYKTKLHCYFLDHSRIVHREKCEKNYQIFYQMLAGLTSEERVKFHLGRYNIDNLKLLQNTCETSASSVRRTTFEAWKSCLSILGIPLSDIMRLLAAIMLLGNIEFLDNDSMELTVKGDAELQAVSALLGMSSVILYSGLTTIYNKTRQQVFQSVADANTANYRRDALIKALYSRTVAAIVKRANSSKRPSASATSSASCCSNESTVITEQLQISAIDRIPNSSSVQVVTENPPTSPTPSRASSTCSQMARTTSDGFIGIVDMFGFENLKTNQLEQLAINLCAETLQHFYNTYIFKRTEEACIEEGIQSDMDIRYLENAPIVELISSQRTGVMSLLDSESSLHRGSLESLMQKIRIQHKRNNHFYEDSSNSTCFTIRHFAGKIQYDSSSFLSTNRGQLPDSLVAIFGKYNCNFGFVSHLFSHELRAMKEDDEHPTGKNFHILSATSTEVGKGSEPKRTFCMSVHAKLDNILKLLVHSTPHFIRCIKCNKDNRTETFDRESVVPQVRAFLVLETVHLMATGFPHRSRYRVFNARYYSLVKSSTKRNQGNAYSESKVILDHFIQAMNERSLPCSSAQWALGKKHLFLSETARQLLEDLRDEKLHDAATAIQARWRCYQCMRNWPSLKKRLDMRKRQRQTVHRKHAKNLLFTNTSEEAKCNSKVLQETYNAYGLDMTKPPPVPGSRMYTVQGNVKVKYPQARKMIQNYTDRGVTLHKGQEIQVMGASGRGGYLEAQVGHKLVYVPYHLTQMKAPLPNLSADAMSLPGFEI